MRTLLFCALAFVLFSGCDANDPEPLPDELRLLLPAMEVEPGAFVPLGLSNRTGQSFAYDACALVLERESGSRWEDVELGRGVINCGEIPRLLEPTDTASIIAYLPSPLLAGTYRFGVPITTGGRQTLYSATFTHAP